MWKKRNSQSISAGNGSVNVLAGRDINLFTANFPTELVEEKIEQEVDTLRKSRFFQEFDRVQSSVALGRRLSEGDLCGATDSVRSRALGWCARFLSYTEKVDKAEEYLTLAKRLGNGSEIDVADAFVTSQKGDKGTALKILAAINTPLARTASLMVVAHHESAKVALDWLKDAGIEVSELDADGKCFVLIQQLELSRWEAARKCLDAVSEEELREAPVLNHLVAIVHLLSAVPVELRRVVLHQVPFEAASFPLASDAEGMEARRVAHRNFLTAMRAAEQLICPRAAAIDDEYALWLELKDPNYSDKGRQRLKDRLGDSKAALRLVHLGLQFGIKLDLKAVEREIEQQIALHGGITHAAAIARFALAFTQQTPEDVANYIARHGDELAKYLDKKSLKFLQIEMLSRAGLPMRANECLDILVEEGLSEAEEDRLRRIISEAEGIDPIEARKEQYIRTGSLGDLVSLVDQLEASGDSDAICEYGQILFERTRSLQDAERLAISLGNTQRDQLLVTFLEANRTLLEHSRKLQMLYCWSLYHEGALLEARKELAKFNRDPDDANYRALQVNLAIALGDWISLSGFVANECLKKDRRNAKELLGAAQLALHLGSPNARELIFESAAKGKDDAGVLAAAYFLASNAGWEDDPEVAKWLHKAAALSGDDGPIQKRTLRDVLDLKPEWDRRESETWQMLSRGDVPMFLAAQYLNKSLVDLMLFPALANLSENDPRRRGVIPAYSGKRQPIRLDRRGSVGMDASALLTLSFLNLLDKAFDAFDAVHVPHSSLTWLFEEKQKATFHQPSRIRAAQQLSHLLVTDAVEKFLPSTVPDSDLAALIGDDLARLIVEAEKVRDGDNTQRIVVRSSPIYRVGSLMEEEADLTSHAAVLSSCQAIVDKIRQKGQIKAEEETKARAYLQLHEKPWPNQPEIADGAILYLDDLALTYFLHLGILERLHLAGFRAVASPGKVSETNELISYESLCGRVNELIERTRSAINSRIEAGRIKVGRSRKNDEAGEESISGHPTIGVLALGRDCDAIIADDRFMNQHANIDNGIAQAPIFSTLDLLDALASTGCITPEDRLEYRTLLRRAGYFFVPVSDDELAGHLNASEVKEGKVIETAELKAIWENVLRVRMSSWLQLPKEATWLDMLFRVFNQVLKGLWKADTELSDVRARSDWIISQVDVRGWAHRLGDEIKENIVKTGRGPHILTMLIPPIGQPRDVKEEYWGWVENRILSPIKGQFPELYSWIVDWQKKWLEEMPDMEPSEGETE